MRDTTGSGKSGRRTWRLGALLPVLMVLFILTLVMPLACPAAAANALGLSSVRGVVLVANLLTPLAGAEVTIQGTELTVRTDSEGQFVILGLQPGRYRLEGRRDGFMPQQRTVEVQDGADVEGVTFTLEPLPRFLGEVVVSPSHYTLFEVAPHGKTSLSREQIDQIPHFGSDVFRAVRWLPGTTGEDLSSQMNVRGGAVDETLVLVDGLEVYQAFHMPEMFSLLSVVDAKVVDDLQFNSGGFAVDYGNRMSGVIDITSSNSGPARTSFAISTTEIGLLSEGSFADGRGRWLLSARRTDLDRVIEWVDPGNGLEPDFFDVLAKLSYAIGDQTTVSANVLIAEDNTHYTEENGRVEEMLDANLENHNLWLNLKTAWTPRFFSQTVLSAGTVAGRRGGFIDYWGQEGFIDDARTLDFYGLRQDWSLDIGERHMVKWGFDLRRLESTYEFQSSSIIRDYVFAPGLEPRYTYREYHLDEAGNTYGLYVADRFRLVDPVVAEVGVRWDRQTWIGDDQFSPRLSVRWELGDRTSLRAAWGLYHQAQLVNELQLSDGVTEFWPAQRAEHRLLSVEHSLPAGFDLRAELYQKRLTEVHPYYQNLLNPIEIFPELEADRILVEPDRAKAQGIEVTIRKSAGRRWDWWLSYAYARVEDEIDGEWVPRNWDQPHSANFSVNFRPTDRWDFNLSGAYHTGWPTTRMYGETFPVPDGTGVYIIPHLGPRNGERLPYYLRLDLRASRDFRLRRSVCSLFLEVTNLLNRDNLGRPESFGFIANPDGSVDVNVEWEGWMPIVPSLGVRWTF